MLRTLAWRRAGLDRASQSGNMAILLTSLLFVFKISFLPKYRINYYDCIIKWYKPTKVFARILEKRIRYIYSRLGQFLMKCKVVGIFGEKLVNIHFYII